MVGYEAARLLDGLMKGTPAPEPVISVEPVGIVTRQSTDVQAHHDDVVASAVRYIREHACRRIDVEDVVQNVKVSRSCLDRRFKSTLGRTPHEEIIRAKLKVAMQLLADTNLNLTEIAA
jgi:LacI family transcriptional regulator